VRRIVLAPLGSFSIALASTLLAVFLAGCVELTITSKDDATASFAAK
jgi:hypothetical protein